VNKVRRQPMDLQSSVAPEDRADVWVEGQTPEGYLQVGWGALSQSGGVTNACGVWGGRMRQGRMPGKAE